MDVVGRRVTVRTLFGEREIDVVVRDPVTRQLHGVEIKSSEGAFTRFDEAARQQFVGDRWINENGADIVGRYARLGRIESNTKILWTGQAP